MVDVTERARKELKRILTSTVDNSYALLRLVASGQGKLGLGIDIELPGDEVLEHQGSGLLLVEHELAARLEGIAIDVDETEEGTQIVICEKA